MQDVVRLLSLGERRLAFVLVTLCLDASEVQSWHACGGRLSRYSLPDARLDDLIRDGRTRLAATARSENDLDAARDHAEFVAIDDPSAVDREPKTFILASRRSASAASWSSQFAVSSDAQPAHR